LTAWPGGSTVAQQLATGMQHPSRAGPHHMRDAHRMKDKLDLSLDSRQVVSLLVAGMVVLGAVFVLGVVVGKKLSEADRAARSPDLLSALDEKAAMQREQASEEPALTFQRTLTEKAPPEPPARPSEPKPAAEKPPPAPGAGAVAAAEAPPAVDEPRPAAAGEAKGTIPPTPVTTRTAPSEERPRTVKLAVQAPRAPTPVAAPTSGWTLQLHASQDRAEASRFAAMMREKGYAPYLVVAEVPGRGTWHRVRLGSFSGREEALRFLQDFKRETGMDAFVAPVQ